MYLIGLRRTFRVVEFLALALLGAVAFSAILTGCSSGSGGGTTGGGGGTQATPDFSVSVSPGALTVAPGATQTVTVSVIPLNGFAQTVAFSVLNAPAGLTVTPSSFNLSAGAQQTLTVAASGTASAATATIAVDGTAGSLSHNGSLSLTVPALVTSFNTPSRTRFVRTNGAEVAEVYDASLRRFFSVDAGLGAVEAFDAVTEKEVGSVSIGQANSIDISPVDGSLWVVSFFGDVWQIDAPTLQVKKRFPAASVGPTGFSPSTAAVLSDGRLALAGPANKFAAVDGAAGVAVWDPVSNSLDLGSGTSVCPKIFNVDTVVVNGDRTRVLAQSIDSDATVCSYDPVGRVATYSSYGGGDFIPVPNSQYFFQETTVNNVQGMYKVNASTLQIAGVIPKPAYVTNQPTLPSGVGGVVSPDGKTLWLTDMDYGVFEGWDTTTLASIGYASGFKVNGQPFIGVSARAIDETGLMFGYVESHGVGFVDVSKPQSNLPGVPAFYIGKTAPTGPVAGGTSISTTYDGESSAPSLTVSSFYVGNAPASKVTASPSTTALAVSGLSPAASQGGAGDVLITFSDGSLAYFPEFFSYGPSIVALAPNAATPEGGQTGALFGYGLGATTSDLTITVGGSPAKVLSLNTGIFSTGYPVPLEYATYQIPAGAAGTAANVTVTTASGSTTSNGSFFYTAASQNFPINDTLEQGIYDAKRNLYYFSGKTSIQVLSGSGGGWQTPIALPGSSANSQMTGIAESPDGTKLAVGDLNGNAVYVLNPDSPSSVQRFAFSPTVYQTGPGGLAISNAGVVYLASIQLNVGAEDAFMALDTRTGNISYPNKSFSSGEQGYYTRVLITPDSAHVISTENGIPFLLDTSTGIATLSYQTDALTGYVADMAISQDGSTTLSNSYIADASLQAVGYQSYIDWETFLPVGTYGQKLRADGGVLYQPLTDGVDVMGRNSGRLLYRVQLATPPAQVYDPIFVAKGANAIGVITATGVSLVDLSSLPISAASIAFPGIAGTVAASNQSCCSSSRNDAVGSKLQRRGVSLRR